MSGAAEQVLVRTTTSGKPLAVERQGREWQVRAEPVRWFERVSWWDADRRMPRGRGRVDVEVWQVQARLGRSANGSLTTMELQRDQQGGGWLLRSAQAE